MDKKETTYRIRNDAIFLCCGKARCPSVQKDKEGMIVIKDDFGGEIKMPKEQADMIKGALEILDS